MSARFAGARAAAAARSQTGGGGRGHASGGSGGYSTGTGGRSTLSPQALKAGFTEYDVEKQSVQRALEIAAARTKSADAALAAVVGPTAIGAVDRVALLSKFGFEAVSDDEWDPRHVARVKADQQPLLEIAVTGHEESDGHTWYIFVCALWRPSVDFGRVEWTVHRRLSHIREGLHDPAKARMDPKLYTEYFGSAPFATRGGLPGTTARLRSWCQAFARAVNGSVVQPGIVAFALRLLDGPAKDPAMQALARSCALEDPLQDLSKEAEQGSLLASAFFPGGSADQRQGASNASSLNLSPSDLGATTVAALAGPSLASKAALQRKSASQVRAAMFNGGVDKPVSKVVSCQAKNCEETAESSAADKGAREEVLLGMQSAMEDLASDALQRTTAGSTDPPVSLPANEQGVSKVSSSSSSSSSSDGGEEFREVIAGDSNRALLNLQARSPESLASITTAQQDEPRSTDDADASSERASPLSAVKFPDGSSSIDGIIVPATQSEIPAVRGSAWPGDASSGQIVTVTDAPQTELSGIAGESSVYLQGDNVVATATAADLPANEANVSTESSDIVTG
eukprot:TRINITY_DN18993_c0_g2_i1.p1 TRINITY_DN18993_c0_g2~~TRINITY_DN18993_c0_g2_i1.p1  ORF type:complete len:570 (-),score=84.96 TRINITY_DN18993_c0_g2_i1:482-2191(-)